MKIIMRVFVSYKLKLFFTVCSHSQLIVSSCILNCRLMNTSTDGAHKKCIRINILIILLNSTFPFLYCSKTKKFCNACYTLYLPSAPINILIILLNSILFVLYCTKTRKFCNACYTLYLPSAPVLLGPNQKFASPAVLNSFSSI